MTIVNKVVTGWVILPCVLFFFFDSWLVDYITPIIAIFITILYLILAFINRENKRFKLDLLSAAILFLTSIFMLVVVYFITPQITKEIINRTNNIQQSLCSSDKVGKDIWRKVLITKWPLTTKLDFFHEGDVVQLRSSPMIFAKRVIIRKSCK